MDPQYVALVSGFVGALVGAGASVITVLIQGHYQHKSALAQQALTLALEDWKTRLEIIKSKGGTALPLAVFISYHSQLIEIARRRQITPEDIATLSTQQERLIAAIDASGKSVKNKVGAA